MCYLPSTIINLICEWKCPLLGVIQAPLAPLEATCFVKWKSFFWATDMTAPNLSWVNLICKKLSDIQPYSWALGMGKVRSQWGSILWFLAIYRICYYILFYNEIRYTERQTVSAFIHIFCKYKLHLTLFTHTTKKILVIAIYTL